MELSLEVVGQVEYLVQAELMALAVLLEVLVHLEHQELMVHLVHLV
jgi:hypothetical protein